MSRPNSTAPAPETTATNDAGYAASRRLDYARGRLAVGERITIDGAVWEAVSRPRWIAGGAVRTMRLVSKREGSQSTLPIGWTYEAVCS